MTKPEPLRFADETTGIELWQITNHDAASEAPYFEAQGFSDDERFLLFRSEREGRSLLYACELETGEIQRVPTPGPVGMVEYTVIPGTNEALCASENALWRIDIGAGGMEQLVDTADQESARLAAFSVDAEGRRILFSRHDLTQRREIPGAIRSSEARGHPATLYLLEHETGAEHETRAERETGAEREILTWEYGFSHPILRPGDPRTATFVRDGNHCWNMELHGDDRTRLIRVDLRTGITTPFATPPLYHTTTHESWSPDGERLFFFDKTYSVWTPVSISSVDHRGGDWRSHYSSYSRRLGHGRVSPDGRYFISDTQDPDDNPLLLIDLENCTARTLCRPNASITGGHAAAAHVHPSFSPHGNYVTYTSDRSGTPQVYVVALEQLQL
jgi:oligogalacturonide lyase